MSQPKPFDIDKQLFVAAFRWVRVNKGAAGVDGTSIAMFEGRLKDNLYKTWNRMSSGTYFPSPLREVVIPKPEGGSRTLAVPTVADRVAQTVAVLVLGPRVEPMFHQDSYGYRPGRSPLDAVAAARQRCWKNDWVIDLDIQAFFDSVPWDKLMAAVNRHLDWDTRWVGLYVERWLKAPLVRADGTQEERTRGCPQGSPVSPLLANIYLHYVFDMWMAREFPGVLFERFSDDVVVHCTSGQQARRVLADIRGRLAECGLELNESKTQVVYCADDGRTKPWDGPNGFDFLGYTFHARTVLRRDGILFVGFTPAISDRNAKRLRREIRRWRLHRRHDRNSPGPGSENQSADQGLDRLLRCVHAVSVVSDLPRDRRLPGAMAATQIQTVPTAVAPVATVPRGATAPRTETVRALAATADGR